MSIYYTYCMIKINASQELCLHVRISWESGKGQPLRPVCAFSRLPANSLQMLLDALYDQLASRGNLRRIAEVLHEPDASIGIEKLVRIFVGFWSSDPIVIRRLRGMAALDAEMAPGLRARDARRQHIARELLGRMASFRGRKGKLEELNLAADVLSMLTSFETYDTLSRAGHSEKEITETVIRLARSAIGLG